jgi:hypothetical protein
MHFVHVQQVEVRNFNPRIVTVLENRAIQVRLPAETKIFPLQTGSGAHPASCTMSIGGPFPGSKARPGRDADHSPPPSAEVVNE